MGRRILVIDDEPQTQVLFQRLVSKVLPDADVTLASCGREGLAKADAVSPDLIILDVVLPDIDGIEVCHRLRERHSSPRIPILMLSGILMDAEHRAEALQSGADGFLCKPFDPIEFMAFVIALLQIRDYEVQRAKCELEQNPHHMRKLAAKCRHAREEDSCRISREIHDELGQALTGLKMDVHWLLNHEDGFSDSGRKRLTGMDMLIATTVTAVRRICSELRPGVLDDLGLAAAIESLSKAFSQRTGIECHLRIDEHLDPLHDAAVTALFRIAQEALTNVARHASASVVNIELTGKNHAVYLCIQDNGCGINLETESSSGSFGLRIMQERALDAAGRLDLSSAPGKGTTIKVYVPARGGRG